VNYRMSVTVCRLPRTRSVSRFDRAPSQDSQPERNFAGTDEERTRWRPGRQPAGRLGKRGRRARPRAEGGPPQTGGLSIPASVERPVARPAHTRSCFSRASHLALLG
jgi:hypothetical protein